MTRSKRDARSSPGSAAPVLGADAITRAEHASRRRRFRRAKIRHMLFTSGPNRLTRGRMVRRHLAQGIEVRELTIRARGWPTSLDGLRVGHVSDFHLGELMPLERAIEVVDLLEDQRPDLVACTGDVVDLHNDGVRPLLDRLAAVDAPMGSWLAPGNHDHLDDIDGLVTQAEAAGVTVLRDDAASIAGPDGRLIVAGIDWDRSAAGCTRRLEAACGDETHLLLAHNPKAFLGACRLGVPLTLSGHTHGGQIALRNRPGANLAVAHRHSAGHYEHRHRHLFVTTGVGAWFPLRVNCPAEVVVLTVRPELPS